jgi:hypothetical protein
MAAAGQTINDRILAARHSIAGQGLAKAVCKATTEEIIAPKKKHLDYLLHCTNEPNVSIPTLANLLIERTQNPHWVVVFKGLITTHHLMCYGNERFTQYLASSNSNFQLNSFLDKGGVQGYDMSPFIRRYANYMSEKSVSYRNVAFDFCKVKRGKEGGTLRSMNTDKLLKTLPHLQQQVDALLEFDCTSQDLNNGVINACFMLLFRDLIRLFACYNDGIINLLEKYFEMNKKQARDALDLYKKFLIRMDRVADFLKVAENVGIDKGDIPDLAKAPSSLLDALEAHLANLEGRKPGSGGTTPTGAARVNVAAAVNALASTSTAFGTAANNGGIDDKTAEKLLQEEAAAMEKFRSSASASNPFAAAPEPDQAEETPNILDLFGVSAPPASAVSAARSPAPAPAAAAAADGRASDDLLQLQGNPFANMLNAAGSGAPVFPTSTPAPFATNGSGFGSNNFASDNSFSNAFGQPSSGTNGISGSDMFADILQPAGAKPTNQTKPKVITSDLDASLANLASNLTFGNPGNAGLNAPVRGPPMVGRNNFQNQPMVGEVISPPKSPFGVPNSSSHPNFLTPGGVSYGNNSSMAGNASSFGGSSFGLDTTNSWGPSPTSATSPSHSFASQQFNTSQAFPTSSPFPGVSPSQSFPAPGVSAIMTPSPSMPGMSSFNSSPFGTQNLNTGFMSLSSSQAFTNNNNEVGAKFLSPNPGQGGAAGFNAGLTAGVNPTNDPFSGLL